MGAGWGVDAKKGRTHQKNLTFETKKVKEKQARGGAGPRAVAAPHAWRGARQPRGAQWLSAQFPSLSTFPAGPGSGHGQPGRQGRGQGAAQQPSVHTHCAIPQQRRPSVRPPRGEAGPTHPHAGPARPSDTGETRDEVGGHTRLLVNHVGGAPRRVGVQQAVHGAEPAEERSRAEHGTVAAPWHPVWGGQGPPSHLDGSSSTEKAPFMWMELRLFSNMP